MKTFALFTCAALGATMLLHTATPSAAAPKVASALPLARGYTVVSGVSISFERTKYKPGETATGKVTLSGEGTDAKPITVSGGATPAAFSLAPGESQAISVKLSNTPGNYQFKAKSSGKESTTTLTVVGKTWNVGKAISKAELTGEETVKVGPGGKVGVGVKDGEDEDEWVYDVGDEEINQKGTEADEIKTYTWTCSGGGFYVGDNADGTPKLESEVKGKGATWLAWMSPGSVTLTCKIDDAPKAISTGEGGTRDDAALERTVTVEVVPVQLLVRRMDTKIPFSVEATIAAGGKGSPEQQANVRVKLPAGSGKVSVGSVKIVANQKGHKGVDAQLSMSTPYEGIFSSHNIVGEEVKLRLEAGPGAQDATVWQTWDEVREWEHDPYFFVDESSPVTYKPALERDFKTPRQPIRNQQVKFEPTSIKVLLWSKEANDWRLYDFNSRTPKWDIVKKLVTFSPETTSSADGVYSTSLFVKKDAKRIVSLVTFDAIGMDVYQKEN